ncbi:MAG TPA: amidohydrolase [Bacteroidota bacterium]|nr:amidohydrolase [Bacteroidota bacterium]
MRFTTILLAAFIMLTVTACDPRDGCDIVIYNAQIHTMSADLPLANAMAISDGRIVAIGENEQILAGWNPDQSIDMGGAHLFPGFIDAHAHLYGLGEEAVILMLHGTQSASEVLAMVRQRADSVEAGAWIRGRGWDQNDWPTAAFPTARQLDSVAADHPVMLVRIDGHAAWVNTRALRAAGINSETPDPDGGKILRDAKGEPTGILLDNAIELVRAHIPPPTEEELRTAFSSAIDRCLALGLTGAHDMGMRPEYVRSIESLIDDEVFPFRVVGYIDGTGDAWEELLNEGRREFGATQLVLAGLKLYADGALGSRGAWLLEDYSDEAGNRGIPITTMDSIVTQSKRALARGLQVCVHAIGDAAVRMVLDAYEVALGNAKSSTPPLRVEHAQVIDPTDVPRFARLGVVPSMQPVHCTSDMYWAEARLGATRIRNAYAWNALIEAGSWIPGGSDFPVERPDPLRGIYAAAFRMDDTGRPETQEDIEQFFQIDRAVPHLAERYKGGWFAAQRMSRTDAVRAFTIWAARAAGMDKHVGSLEKGKLADFVVVSHDLLTISREDFLVAKVMSTWFEGRKVWEYPAGK